MKLGIITDCLKRSSLEDALHDAAELGISGVQMYATSGQFSPEVLDGERIRYYKSLLHTFGLEVSALCGDMGGYGFEIAEDNAHRVEKTKRIIDLACELETHVVTTHIGVIPADRTHPRYSVMCSALQDAGRYAHAHGVTLAIETGPEIAPTLKRFVEDAGEGVGVNLDPANFVMVTGQDPAEAVRLLGGHIVHTHAKDGKKLHDRLTPEDVYHAFAVGGIDALNACTGFEELPIGQGSVNWDEYLSALRAVGYDGYLTIEREAGPDPYEDIRAAVAFLKNII